MRRRRTVKLKVYASREGVGRECELREFEVKESGPSYYRQVTVDEKDEWRVW